MAEGFRYILGRQTIVILISLVAVSAFMSMPYSTLQPVFAGEVLIDSAQPVIRYLCDGPTPRFRCESPEALPLGILLTAVGVGAVIGALAVASLPNDARRGPFLTLGNLGFPAFLIAFSLSRSFLLSLVLLMGVGATFVFQNSLANTLLQLAVPDEVRGRVMSVYTLVFQTMMRLGGLQAGLMADRFGAPFAVFIGALISLGYGLYVAVRYPRVRNMA
jgi:Zn-dependent protease with chaperone function